MTRAGAMLATLGVLAGCGATERLRHEYHGVTPSTVPVSPGPGGPEFVEVRLHPSDSGRAWVAAPKDFANHAIVWRGTDQWIATAPRQRAAYEAALLEQLPGQCQVDTAAPYPAYYAFEFAFRCQ